MPSQSAPNSNPKWIYDVYLSFNRQEEELTPASFISHLRSHLIDAGVYVYREQVEDEIDDPLPREDQIPTSQLRAIQRSNISIIVFSTNYAASQRCLQELDKIIECRTTMDQVVVPVFCGVKPSEIVRQGDVVPSLRTALHEVGGGFTGFFVKNSRDEIEIIEDIVEDVIGRVDSKDLFVADYLVGLEFHVKELVSLLNRQPSEDVRIVGMCGFEGVGKTTLAKAIYNHIGGNFEGRSFLQYIMEVSEDNNTKVSLQEQLLSDIYKTRKIKIQSIEEGKIILKERLRWKKVLIVIDDVWTMDELEALCGSHKWFGPGSTIIFTTRNNKHLLRRHGVGLVYEIGPLNFEESFELFSRYAFKQAHPRRNYVDLSRKVVKCCGGLPLLLEVLGSHLLDREIQEWESALQKLESESPGDVISMLKVSFDGLDDHDQEIFLQINLFYIGMDKNEVMEIMNGCRLNAKCGIRVLLERRLVTIDNNNKLGMHDVLREMGNKIFYQRSQKKPGAGIYDVFLSFRGKDTRASFTSHLHTALENAGIYVFKDDDSLSKEDEISTSLLQAIQGSRISIIIFSKNYANSKWCLVELQKIMERRITMAHVVLPVFYGVDPSEVRNQTGIFGEGFEVLAKRISTHTVLHWRIVLRQTGRIAGFVVINSRNESQDIENVVEHVTRLLDKTELFVANYPVGVEYRVEDVIQELKKLESKDVLLLGIWGMGGLGKTTIAKAIYNKIGRDFDGRTFLLNVREVWEQANGQVYLQQRILSGIYKTTKENIDSIESGKSILNNRLRRKKVLIVLDDVDKTEQLDALCGSDKWFGKGSRIIITSRDEHLLKVCRIDLHIYKLKKMDENESIELFSWCAFKQRSPKEEYATISRDVVAHSGGLPLALEVIGSYLVDRGIMEWKSVLEQLKIIPNDKVQKKLKISFDGLSDDLKKEIFLDIAFFFVGMDQNDVIQILNGCGFFAEIGLSVLRERSLVTIDDENKLGMHDLVRDMAREIVRGESDEPEERSRLWVQKEVIDILSKNTGTKAVKGLTLQLQGDKIMSLHTKAFKKMKKLRLLQLSGVQPRGDFEYLSRNLRWVCWHEFPLTHIPAKLYQESFVAIELEWSKLKLVWKEVQLLENLKILNLSHSHELRQTPDFSKLPNLEKLVLKDCQSLCEISHTIGNLNKLLEINLENCISLGNLPRSIYKLKSLKTLILSGCLKIDKLEEDLEQMESLTTLLAEKTAISKVPFSLVRSRSIGYISLCGFEGFSGDVFPSIIWSWISPTNGVLSLVQTSAGMSYLVSSDIPNSSSQGLSSCFKDIQVTEDAERISEAIPEVSNVNTTALVDCPCQDHISGSQTSFNSLLIQMGISQVTNTLRESILQNLTTTGASDCLLPGDSDPDWLTFNGDGSSVSFEVPRVNGRNLKTMMLCIIYASSPDSTTSEALENVMIINGTKNTSLVFRREALASFEDDKWQGVISNLESHNKVEICVVFEYGFIVKKTAVYLIYEELADQNIKRCHAPEKNVIVSSNHKSVRKKRVPVLPLPEVTESLKNPDSEIVPPSHSIHMEPTTHGFPVGRQEPLRDPVKGKAPLNFNVSVQEGSDEEKDPLAELESLLLGSNHPSPKPTFNPDDAAIKEAFYKLEFLLKNSLKSLLNDEELCRQLYLALDHLEDAEDKLPNEVADVVASIKASMPELVDRFNSVKATVNDQRSRLGRKEVLIKLTSEARKRQEKLNTEVNEGKKKVDELDKQIKELVRKRDVFKSGLEKCEGEKKKLKEDTQDWLTECKGLLTAIEMNEVKYKTALNEEADIQTEWDGFRRKLNDILPPKTR